MGKKWKNNESRKIFFDEQITADFKIDCKNAIIAPGFIELQINGGYGIDFSQDVDLVDEGVGKVAKHLLRQGVTSFCPTIITSPKTVYEKVIPKIKRKKVISMEQQYWVFILKVHLLI